MNYEFIIKSAFALALLYSLFFVSLSRETFHRFNRIALLFTMTASLILPLGNYTTTHPTVVQEVMQKPAAYLSQTPVVYVYTSYDGTGVEGTLTWGTLFSYIYIAGVIVMALLLLLQTIQMYCLIRGGLRHTDNMGNTVILKPHICAPFSIFHWIVMSVDDYEKYRLGILAHEQEHIRQHHTYDLLLLEGIKVIQWFNPFIWLIDRDLRAIHEYEADEAVINQGIDAKQYQQLLVLKAVGNRLQPFANTLGRGSLKKRIIMMYQKKSNRWMMLKALFVIPVIGVAVYTFATPETMPDIQAVLRKEVTMPIQTPVPTMAEEVTLDKAEQQVIVPKNDKVLPVKQDSVAPKGDEKAEKSNNTIPAEPSSYQGGEIELMKYLARNLQYPQIAQQYKVSGRILLEYSIEPDGTLSNIRALKATTHSSLQNEDGQESAESVTPEAMEQCNKALMEEAIRVAQTTSGKWIPSKDKDGNKIRTLFCLPVVFKLQPDVK